jgi:biopolymer transport protein ExbD
MRRFSQKSSLVTLSEINITPLLDLAFVLLIIFIIAAPLLQENSLKLTLPKGGEPEQQLQTKDIRTVEIARNGVYTYNGRRITLQELERQLTADYVSNPDLVVFIRADEAGFNKHTYAVINVCQRNGITRFSLRTEPGG